MEGAELGGTNGASLDGIGGAYASGAVGAFGIGGALEGVVLPDAGIALICFSLGIPPARMSPS